MSGRLLGLLGLSVLLAAGQVMACDKECLQDVDNYLEQKMAVHKIPGLSALITQGNGSTYYAARGLSDIANNKAMTTKDSIRLYSATKILVTVGIFQLIEQGKLSLETPVSEVVDDTPTQWKDVKVKHLLSHSSGIYNFIRFKDDHKTSNHHTWNKLVKKPLDFKPGARHAYNQTNFWLLDIIIQQISGVTLQQFIVQNQFDNNDSEIFFSSKDTQDIKGRVPTYGYDKSTGQYKRRTQDSQSRGHAGNGISVSTNRLAVWLKKLTNNQLLKSQSMNAMLNNFNYSESKTKFRHGLANYMTGQDNVYGFSGGGVSSIRCWQQRDFCVAILTNGFSHYPVVNEMVDQTAWIIDPGLTKQIPQRLYQQADLAIKNKYYDFDKNHKATDNYPESYLNSLGYRLLGINNIPQAIKAFKLAVKHNSNSWNAHDSLGEAYMHAGDFKKSIASYKQALKLNPSNKRIPDIIKRLDGKLMKITQPTASLLR